MDIERQFSKIAFIFLIFVVISGGFIQDILSCQMQSWLTNSLYARHIIGVIMIFVFIMLEGGWDMDKENEEAASNDWSSGNTVHSFLYAIVIYSLFVISSKSKLLPNLLFFSCIFILYFANTYRSYLEKRNQIDGNTNEIVLAFEYVVLLIGFIALFYGFYNYTVYKREEYGRKFSWYKFMAGTTKCDFK